jgi:hypothetical protein
MYTTRDAMTRRIAWAAATDDRTTPLAPTGEQDQRAGQWQWYRIIKPTFPAAVSHLGASPVASAHADRSDDISRQPNPAGRAMLENRPRSRFAKNTRHAFSNSARAWSNVAAVPSVHSRGWAPG